jgi:hypothetical protein
MNRLGGNEGGWADEIDLGWCGDCVDVSVNPAGTGITVARHPDIALKVPDETRPVNMALLACIKY